MINKKETADAMYRTCTDSCYTIQNLCYHFKDEYINVTSFDTPQNPNDLKFEEYDIVKNNGINRIPLGPQLGNMGANMQKVVPKRR
jgi:coproporphyrinogen III oxidase-like Fe-S oxidoreductase